MILQALYRLYEYLAEKGLAQEPGWTGSKISYALNLDDDGRISNVFSLRIDATRGKKTVQVPQVLKTPMAPKRTVGIEPAFLFDNSSYILGIDAKGKPERARNCFEACKALHLEVLNDVDTPAVRAVKAYFLTWNPDAARDVPRLKDYLDDILTGVNLLFYYDNHSVVDDASIRDAWQRRYDGGVGEKIRCLVTGEMAKLARIHPAIKGVRGGQSSGTALVSFNAPAFESFGREQGMNAPIGERAAFAYTTALNYLIADHDRQCMIGDTLVLMWSESGETAYQDCALAGLNMSDDAYLTGSLAESAIVGTMDKLSRGEPVYWDGVRIDPNMRYYIFGISPNAARLSVRFFLENSFGGFMRAAKNHDARMEIVRPSYDQHERISVKGMMKETINLNYSDKNPMDSKFIKQLTADTLRSILSNAPYPSSLINAVELRIRAERSITRGRAAIIKAYYLQRTRWPKEVLEMDLRKLDRDCDYIPYVLGRLLSVLDQVQERSLNKDKEKGETSKATMQFRYFNSASATPAVIFPTLIHLAKVHLRKLDDGDRIHYEKQITALMNKIHTPYPARMNQADRGIFQLGFYHQQQDRYTKKTHKEDDDK